MRTAIQKVIVFVSTFAVAAQSQAFQNPEVGEFAERDPLALLNFIQQNGPNPYAFARNNSPSYVDPLGLRLYVMTPDVGGLDDTHFDDYVIEGFQKVIGDCARLRKTPIFQRVETGFLFWKKTQTKLVGWEIYYTDQKANCVCNPCWKTLRNALGDNLPTRDVFISRGDRPFFLDNAATLYGPNGVSQVGIYEGISGLRPEVNSSGQVVWNPVRFDVVLWHEAIGHGYLGLDHPNTPANQRGGPGPDPTIVEENNARNCLRLQGVSINDRVPTYYGWK